MDLSALTGLTVAGRDVTAEAGVRMGRLARVAAGAGLSGLEFMATVPGDVGGGVAMNAGAFGQEVADSLRWVEVALRGGEVRRLEADVLAMRYRHAELPAGSLVLAAGFSLRPADSEAIRDRMREMRERRGVTQPLAQPNCGSVFKNPAGDHAARLIEAAGLKGLRIGGARISELHANFIVNEGGATSRDVRALIARAQAEVKARFGVRLEPEVRMLEAGA
jgi:UDP-N-acetylmuramate dehydrogenase